MVTGEAERDPAVPIASDATVRVRSLTHDVDLSWVVALLADRRDEILARWLEAATDQPFHRARSERAVADHVPRLFDALVKLLSRHREPERNPGSPLLDPAVLEAAQQHARTRFQQGFSPPDVAVEFRLLRQEIGRAVRLYVPERAPTSDVVGAELLLHDALDGAVFVALTTLDVHEAARREMEAALRASELRFRLLVESVQDYAIYTLTPDGRVASWNAGAERIFGSGADEILDKPHGIFFGSEDQAAGKPERLLALAATDGRATDDGMRQRRDGTRFVADTVLTALHDEAGTLVGFANITRDVSERRRIDEERTSASHEREAILTTLGHDLKSPLSSATAIIQLLQRQATRDAVPADQMIDRLTAAQAALHRTALRIDELMDLTRRDEDDRVRGDLPEVDLVGIARDVVAAYRWSTERHEFTIDARVDALVGRWDRARLERCIDNLLSNAVKFSPRGGPISVELGEERVDGRRVAVLTVRDQGLGIPEAERERVFERFRRASNVGAVPGSGVGLWSVRRVVERHGGSVSVTSRQGSGSAFTIRLPMG